MIFRYIVNIPQIIEKSLKIMVFSTSKVGSPRKEKTGHSMVTKTIWSRVL